MTFTVAEPLEAPAEFFCHPRLLPKQILFGTDYSGNPSTNDIETRYQQLSQKWATQESILTTIQAAQDFLTSNVAAEDLSQVLKKGAFGRVQKVVQEISEFKLQCPNIAVIGGENQGKSSMLERIVKHAIFPRDRRTSTILPITFKLCNIGNDDEPSIKVRSSSSGSIDEPVRKAQRLSDDDGCQASIKVRRVSLDGKDIYDEVVFKASDGDGRIYDAVEKAQQEAAKDIENEKVEVIVKAKDVPDLVFVDYPGLTTANVAKKTRIEQLTKNCINQSDTLLVCVISATSESLDDIPVAGLLQNHSANDDPWKRSICVLTKCDRVSEYEIEFISERLLRLGNEAIDINCEMIGVVNRDTEMTRRTGVNLSFEEARWQEYLWYKKNLKNLEQHKFGIDAVLMNLNKLVEEHVVEKWLPDQIAEINKKQEIIEEELLRLGRQPSPGLCKQLIKEVHDDILRQLKDSQGNFFLSTVRGAIADEVLWQQSEVDKVEAKAGPVMAQVICLHQLDSIRSSKPRYFESICKVLELVVNKLLEICNSSSLPLRFERFKDLKSRLKTKLEDLLASRVEDSVELIELTIRDMKRHLSSQGQLQHETKELQCLVYDQITNSIVSECIVPGVWEFLKWLDKLDDDVEKDFLGNEYFNGNTGYRVHLKEKIAKCIQAKSTIRFTLLKYDQTLGIDKEMLSKICTEKPDVETHLSYVKKILQKIESSDDKYCHEMTTKLQVPHDLMSVMKFFLEDSVEIQIKSVEALCGLCRTDEIRKLIAEEMGGVEKCVLAMERYDDNVRLRETCKKFVKNVSCNRDTLLLMTKARRDGLISALKLEGESEDCKEILRGLDTFMMAEYSKDGICVAFNHDGTRIAYGCSDNSIRIWDAETGTPIGVVLKGHSCLVWSVAFNHDGTRIVSGSRDSTVRIWDARTGEQIGKPLQDHSRSVKSVTFNHDGTRIVSGSRDGTSLLWDARTGKRIGPSLLSRPQSEAVGSVAFNHNGTRVVSGSFDNIISLWSTRTGKKVSSYTASSRVMLVTFNHDGTRILSFLADSSIVIWDLVSRGITYKSLCGHSGPVGSVAFNHDGTRLVSVGLMDNTVCHWDIGTGKLIASRRHNRKIRSVAFNHDGTCVVLGSAEILVWDTLVGGVEGS